MNIKQRKHNADNNIGWISRHFIADSMVSIHIAESSSPTNINEISNPLCKFAATHKSTSPTQRHNLHHISNWTPFNAQASLLRYTLDYR